MEIKFKTKEQPEARTVEFAMPENLQDLIARFGEQSVYDNAVDSYVISIQSLCRRHIAKSDEELTALVADWKPGERSASVKQSAFEKASNALGKLSPEERAALLEKLRAG